MIIDGLVTVINEAVEETILNKWRWLIGTDKKLITITFLGDAFFSDCNGLIYWLDAGTGVLTKVADSFFEFTESLTNPEVKDEWLLPDLLVNLRKSGLECTKNQVYSYKRLPILGGRYEVDNFFCLNIIEHFSLTSHIHF